MKSNPTFRIVLSAMFILLLLPAGKSLAGGPAFKEINKIKLPFTPSTHWYTHTDDFKFFLCSTKSDMLMLDGISGKILWQTNFKKDYKNEKFANQFWNKEANVVLVYDEDTKKGIAIKYFIDGKSGKILWSSDKYVSDLGDYELSDGFSNYYDPGTKGVLLPTKESVDFVDVTSGKILWSKAIAQNGKNKDFDCFIMSYYDLVKISGKETEIYLTTADGKEVTDIEPYFNKKKYMSDSEHAFIIDIPDKNMYVLMQGETNKFIAALAGMSIPRYKMNFRAYKTKTDEIVWNKQYTLLFDCDLITLEPFIRMYYDQGRLFVEHDHFKSPDKGLTVLNPDNGEIMWEAQFRTEELKSKGLTKLYITPFPAPHPLTKNGKTFVVNKTENIVSCYDASKGTKIWDSEKYPDAQKIPALFATEKLLIMGHGGDAVKTVSIAKSSGSASDYDYRNEYNNKDKYGIIAYDAATGKVVWSNETIEKSAKDKFEYIAGLEMINGKLYCATDKNFFILDPETGNVEKSVPVAKEKVGDAWKMIYFEKEQKIIINCEKGIVKLDPIAAKVEGKVETPTMPFMLPFNEMKADDYYKDYAVFTSGDAETWKLKEFASIDLDNMKVRGLEEGDLLFYETPRFSQGGEMFYKVDDEEIRFFSVK